MDVYTDSCDIDIFKEHVKLNKPLIIRNFLKSKPYDKDTKCYNNEKYHDVNIEPNYQGCSIELFLDYINEIKLYCTSYGCYNKGDQKICCSIPFIKSLMDDKDYLFKDMNRFWSHDKDNFTRNHYDGNGIEILNISLKGQKIFYLADPSKKIKMFPISNVSITSDPDDSFYDYKIVLEPGDLLYIPSYWWHKVITTQDKTVNINFNFYKYDYKIDETKKNIFNCHRLTNTKLYQQDPIFKIIDLTNHSTIETLQYVFKECYIYFILIFIVGFFISKGGLIITGTVIMFLFICLYIDYSTHAFMGYAKLILSFIIPFFILGNIVGFLTGKKVGKKKRRFFI